MLRMWASGGSVLPAHHRRKWVSSGCAPTAEALAARALYCSLMLAIHLDDGQGDLQNKFFDLLKGMKIGVELNPIKLPAWQGYGPDAGE
ncbi:hypothetical protein NMB32_03535 [Stenotrophomonas sp. CD2]|nr:hypothetical protein NMB32_03535 [Stenotrophomonas sp. CD2]